MRSSIRSRVLSGSQGVIIARLPNPERYVGKAVADGHASRGVLVCGSGIGMAIAVGCLGFSHYILGLDNPVADNISANVVGLVLGTVFRFWSYRKWVFPEVPDDAADQELAAVAAELRQFKLAKNNNKPIPLAVLTKQQEKLGHD